MPVAYRCPMNLSESDRIVFHRLAAAIAEELETQVLGIGRSLKIPEDAKRIAYLITDEIWPEFRISLSEPAP